MPVRYLQLDDWWYSGCSYATRTGTGCSGMSVKCVDGWEFRADLGPGGLAAVQREVGLPLSLYIMYFCRDNEWARRGLRFVNGSDAAHAIAMPHPEDARRIFDEIMSFGVSVGMQTYEQVRAALALCERLLVHVVWVRVCGCL